MLGAYNKANACAAHSLTGDLRFSVTKETLILHALQDIFLPFVFNLIYSWARCTEPPL